MDAHYPFLFIMIYAIFFTTCNSISFEISEFSTDSKEILFDGDAGYSAGMIEIISQQSFFGCRVGRAIYEKKVRIWDSDTNLLTDFNTHFTFSIDTFKSPPKRYGSGLAFFLAPVNFQIPLNSMGAFLGLFNISTVNSSHNQIVAVEFDSFNDPEWDPPNMDEHIGININSISSVVAYPWNASLHTRDNAEAWITYNATTKNLSVLWSYPSDENFSKNSSLSYLIDLSTVLPEWVIIGFSATTGRFTELNDIKSWTFYSSLDTAEVVNGNKSENMAKIIKIVVGITAMSLLLAAGGFTAFLIFRRWRSVPRETKGVDTFSSMNVDLEQRSGPRSFSYQELASATNNFSHVRKLGSGGFGNVYKGHLIAQDVAIAVKRFSKGSKQGWKEFSAEVKTISQLRHRNLVQLIGWSHDQGEFLLAYEFMPNGSLDHHIFYNDSPLPWPVRYKITIGLASALLYLHEEWDQCVLHRDIKASNVLLDSEFNVKLGDFGLARLVDHDHGPKTTALAGTWGYMAPEYMTTGKASKESDVYSFGVVTLELVSGRKSMDPVDESLQAMLIEWVWNHFGKEDLLPVVDRQLQNEFNIKQAEVLLVLGLWCVHPDAKSRPLMRQVIQALHSETVMPNLPLQMPVPFFYGPSTPVSTSDPSTTASSSVA